MAGWVRHSAKCIWSTTQLFSNLHFDAFPPRASGKGYSLLKCVVLILKEWWDRNVLHFKAQGIVKCFTKHYYCNSLLFTEILALASRSE